MTLKDLWEFMQQYLLTGQTAAVLLVLSVLVEVVPIQAMTEACGAFVKSADKASEAFTEVTEKAPVAYMKGIIENLAKH